MKTHSHFETFLVTLFVFFIAYICSQADSKLRERIEVLEEKVEIWMLLETGEVTE